MGIPKDRDDAILEIVLHNLGRDQILDEFCAYAKTLDSFPIIDRTKKLNGLTFVPVRSNLKNIEKLAAFTFVRVARGMPSIRPVPTGILRGSANFALDMPTEGPLSNDVRAVIFDGGLPPSVDLGKWVHYIQPPGIGQPIPNYVLHGLGVTSAFLFGSIHQGVPLRRPFCQVDHVRVLDATPNKELEYIDVLDRILAHLDANNGKYKFVNLSLGPDFPMEDDDVNMWTSSLDIRFCTSDILATVAAGNNGELDASLNLNRIQPPSDGVNQARPDGGTSFASPFVLGGAVGTRVFAGDDLHSLAIRALLIHRAEAKKHSRTEVGWGLLHTNPKVLMTCEDHEAMVVYQGDLPLGQHLRAMIPVPIGPLSGPITLRATLAIAPDVDPEHPGAYTRGGLEVCFRPDMRKFTTSKDGKKSAHP